MFLFIVSGLSFTARRKPYYLSNCASRKEMNLITLVIRLTKMELPHCLSNDASRKKRPYPTEVFSNKLSVSHRVAPDDLFKIFSSYLIAFFSALPRALALLLLVSCCGVL